ncbi:excinuclease ABC subunit A [Cephaloticoccus primus]|uniref:UvrABC system protein A n=1 Tax=Cephaloticoccus primus TaxID=1548207 RepID=A0A139SJL8_9BACT|nr:excinuclease ABC subunit A [Cephaloticoccus primus]
MRPSAARAKKDSSTLKLRGVRQNNLKGFDLDLPLGKYIAVTGLSGSGKSSLVFDTLHAEGQRRYVETFSAYTRQFLELLPAPKVDSIENIRPSIAIEQTNTVKTSRSTVGTMTELCDYFKVWFAQNAHCYDPDTGEEVEDDTPASIWQKTLAGFESRTLLLCFAVNRPAALGWGEIFQNLKAQGYTRVIVGTRVEKIDALADSPSGEAGAVSGEAPTGASQSKTVEDCRIYVIQDRLTIQPEARARFLEAAETALHFGQGQVFLFSHDTSERDAAKSCEQVAHFSKGLHSPGTGRQFRAASPALFSFNSPLGACPRCRGFGRVIEVDYRLAIPDHSLSIEGGAIKCWESDIYGESKKDLLKVARRLKIPTRIPFAALTPEQRDLVIYGEPDYNEAEGRGWPKYWYGLKGFFDWLEKNTYKMHVRVFLSRYRSYNTCPDCHGARLQPEALCWRWQGRTLPELYQLPVSGLLALIEGSEQDAANKRGAAQARSAEAAVGAATVQILTRLRYLEKVGLGYLTLDRSSRTLSGGEVERVNLTSCLGSSLVDTLFVLDEPSVGLHPRDIDRLIEIIRSLTAAGNTVVVVEHDEAMIRAADHVVEIGPEAGSAGGHVVFQGSVPQMLAAPQSLTGAYFSGREKIDAPRARREVTLPPLPASQSTSKDSDAGSTSLGRQHAARQVNGSAPQPPTPALHIERATKHNLRELSLRVPLQRFVALSGVSGSGKSTLLNHVIYQGLMATRGQHVEEPATIGALHCDLSLGEVVLVDQSPLARTPRSNPALYCEAWDDIRALYAATPAAQAAGLTASSFSFNSGDGRCEHCQGRGYEKVEMQFLSDVFVPCPVCEGRRFKPETLAIRWREHSVADLLETSVSAALPLFADQPRILEKLSALDSLGLGYLTLGQPLNTLSGGEAQRLKLLKYLSAKTETKAAANAAAPAQTEVGALLLLDEPTTGLHPHDIKRLLGILQNLVDGGHSVIVIEHNLDVLKSADWLIEVGPDAGSAGGRIVAAGTPEQIAQAATATSPFLRRLLQPVRSGRQPAAAHSVESAPHTRTPAQRNDALTLINARENNLKNLSLTIPHHTLSVVTGVSGSGKSTLAFDIIFAEGQRRFMESMSAYARQFVEQLPRPAIDSLSGIPPTVAIEQRVTRGSRKSTVATITEVAQYLRLLYARLGMQHHPETGRPVTPLSPAQLRELLARLLDSPEAQHTEALYLCAPLIRGRKGHHQPIATWIDKQGYTLMRADGRVLPVAAFEKLDRYREHDIEVVIADLKRASVGERERALDTGLKLGKSTCLLVSGEAPETAAKKKRTGKKQPAGKGGLLRWLSTTRTDAETGESFPELDPKHFSFNSPRGWCPTCRGHGMVFPWMLEQAADDDDDPTARLRNFGIETGEDISEDGQPCPDCHGTRLNRVSRAVRLYFKAPAEMGRAPAAASTAAATAVAPAIRDSASLPELLALTPAELLAHLARLDLDARGRAIAQDIIPQIEERLKFLDSVGLGYLSLDRPTATLSGGEAQRIRLAAQLGSNLSGVLYVLDEPSIGLHARDNDSLIETLQALRTKNNTLLVVEHDDTLMERADHIIDLGPAAGLRGGELLASGTPAQIKRNAKSLTGLFLKKGISHPTRGHYRTLPESLRELIAADTAAAAAATAKTRQGPAALPPRPRRKNSAADTLTLRGATLRNLRGIDLHLPLGRLIMVAGPSGAGKSTLFRDILHPAVTQAIKTGKAKLTPPKPKRSRTAALSQQTTSRPDGAPTDARTVKESATPFAELINGHRFKSVIEVDQSPIGKTPRSTPATYLGIFDLIRQFFASLPEAKMRGYSASRFSFNTAGGRCETCAGAGRIKLEMAFMPATYLPCEDCGGSRYAPEISEIRWKGKSIGEVLQMSFEEAAAFFDFHSRLAEVCQLMVDCGLGYLSLGQSSPTLSGGEAQRLKLVTELVRGLSSYREKTRGQLPHNLYILEEPSIGLHLSDCEKLIGVLHSLVDQGHTVIVIEHHLDLLAEADYLVELGPSGGPGGGQLLYQGELPGLLENPELAPQSPTAPYLREKLQSR